MNTRPIPEFLRADPLTDLVLEFQNLRVLAAYAGLALTGGPASLDERISDDLNACVDRMGGLIKQLSEETK